MNFSESSLAFKNPSDISMFSQIKIISGTIIAQLLNRALRFSGNSVLTAYHGFIVIKNPTVILSLTSSSWKLNTVFAGLVIHSFNASKTVLT